MQFLKKQRNKCVYFNEVTKDQIEKHLSANGFEQMYIS